MLQATKEWRLPTAAPPHLLATCSEHPLLVQVLYGRGLQTASAIDGFLNDGAITQDNPYRLRDMNVAVARIDRAIETGEVICVYGDFDADGVTSTALLVSALQAAGGKVGAYIPDRVDEGYGLNIAAIEKVASKARLIITVDCGIRSHAEVAHACALGVDVIITDHHSVAPKLPPALAVINPRRSDCTSGYERLAGVGVAYRLAQAVLRVAGNKRRKGLSPDRVQEIEEELLDLVALGTVADMMPLQGENRPLVQRGLARMRRQPRFGIAALMASASLSAAGLDSTAISFRLAPRINAAGRLGSAMTAYRLLRIQELEEARQLAQQLEALNTRRQNLVVEAQSAAELQIASHYDPARGNLLFVQSPDIASGIVGLVAGKLTERYYRPAVVIERGAQESRGSARSIREFDITAALDEIGDLFVRHGGHSRAAGFTIRSERLPELEVALQEIATRELSQHATLRPKLQIDAMPAVTELNWSLLQQFKRLEPTGQENAQPLLLSRQMRVRSARAIGSDRHLRLVLDNGSGQYVYDGIAFNMGGLTPQLHEGMRLDVVYHLERNDYNGRQSLQLNIQDMQQVEHDGW